MPFPEPETALAATIVAEVEAEVIRGAIVRLGASQGPSTTFQSLARRLNDLHRFSLIHRAEFVRILSLWQ